ncbi:glycosyltransferase [Senegalia massiliensis]|uniref:Glycosyltransferase n=1 Tax=Senegalia massiliensis TaxID=1720316 RepID=A0A845QZW5_9CLOT|nr:glycosyltransferase [Senegalia massiliensis]NBI07036.1 glycosyltransferase [Senegalia massiliensis]
MKNSKVLVSINCITYNHEQYIAEAIESFLMQETNFKYEILIHDDASTDKTTEIIKEYEKKYPHIIKPIYQSENQYSKGKKATYLNLKRDTGKYIAMCEGDDYWTDTHKLQKQVDILESNSNLVATFHRVEEVTPSKERKNTYVEVQYEKINNIYDIEDIIRFDGKRIHVSSLMFRSKYFDVNNLPLFFHTAVVGDLPMMLILASKGDFYYFDKAMSSTRRGVVNGASERLFNDKKKRISTNNKIIETYAEFNEYTDYKYDIQVNEVINLRRFLINKLEGNFDKIKKTDYFKNSRMSKKAELILYCYFPELCHGIVLLRNNLMKVKTQRRGSSK